MVANTQWCSIFKEASFQVLAGRTSDHKPIPLLLDANLQVNGTIRRGFKFELNWSLEEDYQQIIEEAWNEVPNEDAISKLSKCQTSLQQWSKGKLGDSAAQIKLKTQKLEVLQCNERPENSE